MLVKHLKPNKLNPRKITAEKKAELKSMMQEYGDLSGITYNIKNESLATGHQRVSQMDKSAKVVYEVKHDKPTEVGTVAEGYILFNGERFKYREVSWEEDVHNRAMLAANKGGGEFDRDVLNVVLTNLKFEIKNTGFDQAELKEKFKINIPVIPKPVLTGFEPSSSDEEEDANYIQDNPGPDSSINKESISTAKSFDEVEEKAEPVNKRFVIIIDCPSFEVKDQLKEKLLPEITQAGAKIF
mgnify:CR=1 FL=1